jgi:hypothetical protein
MARDDSKKVNDMNLATSQFSLYVSFLRAAMFRAPLILLLVLTAVGGAPAQTFNCGAGTSTPSANLACLAQVSLTPSGFSPASPGQPAPSNLNAPNSLGFLSGAIGAEVSQIPLASPASGIIYTNNPTTQLPERLDQSFGPILTQRAQTIGKHNRYFAMTYQYFLLQDIDSLALKNLPAVIYLNSPNNPASSPPDFAGISQNYIQLKVHQSVGYFTYGLTSRMDVSVAVPLLRVDLRDTFAVSYFPNPSAACFSSSSGCPKPPAVSSSRAGEATGIGDVVLATKVNLWKLRRAEKDHGGFSLGAEVRLPSGDSKNYLGSGAYGVKPFVTFSYAGRWSPHFNVGYQINGKSDLITGPFSVPGNIVKGHLPDRLIYSGGIDFALFKKLTVNVDGIAQRVIDAPRATLLLPPISLFGQGQNVILQTPVVEPSTSSYTRADAAGGIKWNPFKGLLLSGNVSVKLNQAGLRSRVVPLGGASYTF